MDEQREFRAGRGCVGQVFVVRQVVEKTTEKDKEAYMAFVDLEKAYDDVSRRSYRWCWRNVGWRERWGA